ncbi:SAM50-like protein SPAC17C9.06 [Bienertia sinuspersici]
MSPKPLSSRQSIDSCLFQLHTWKPFSNYSTPNSNSKTLDSDSYITTNPNSSSYLNHKKTPGLHPKRPCLSDRATSLFSLSIDSIDFSKLSLFDDGVDNKSRHHNSSSSKRDKLRWMAKKRRRRGGSRSISGRSSDRSGTRNGRCCSVGATATATCSDFMVGPTGGTDSSGELFVNGGGGNVNGWASDVSEARRERERVVGERESLNPGFGLDSQGNESGYGSEPGYRGDAEFGYGDEVDEEEEDARLLLWGERIGGTRMEMIGENSFSEQKAHHRGRRKKHDWRLMASVR